MKLPKNIKLTSIIFRRFHSRKLRYKLLSTFLFGNIIASIIIISGYAIFGGELRLITFSMLTCVAGLFSVLIDYYISQPVTDSIDRLTRAARQIARGKFKEGLVEVKGQSELYQLADAFNIMNYRLNEAFLTQKRIEKARRDLVTNISHDLKTPLATIQLFTESILDGVLENKEEERRYLQTILKETNNIQILIDQLAQLSKFEAGEIKLNKEKVDLVELFCNFLKSVQLRLEEKNINLLINIPDKGDEYLVIGDSTKIYQVIANLINNSIKYTAENGEIIVEIIPLDKMIRINVIDNGIGIPEDEQDKIFERFYRVDKARKRGDNSSGLGLAIAREIIRIHHGEIWVESKEGQGSKFSFTLPKA